MAITLTKTFDENAFAKVPASNSFTCATYAVSFTVNYPAGGEPIDLGAAPNADFSDVFFAICNPMSDLAGGTGAVIRWQPDNNQKTKGHILVFVTGAGAGLELAELAAGAYPAGLSGKKAFMLVWGNPITSPAI